MRNNQPITQTEVLLTEEDILVSTTDTQGVITSVSPAFVKISGFSEQELLGQSHNIVRHPDMPPEAFESLWNTVKTGQSWNGRVKNRCKNGDYYWVDAHVSPIYSDGKINGFRSLRIKPSREAISLAEALYADIKAGRIKKPFQPQKSIFGSLRLWQKFMALILLTLLMFAAPTGMLISRANEEISFAAKEKLGVDYVHETINLLQLIQTHRGLANIVLSGDIGSSAQWENKRREINQQIRVTDAIDSRLSELGLTEAWKSISNDWQRLESTAAGMDPKTSTALHNALIAKILTFNRTISDASGLALDPEMDSYYLMLVSINQLPNASELLGQLRAKGAFILQQKDATSGEKAVIQMLMASLLKDQALIDESIAKINLIDDALRSDSLKMADTLKEIIRLTEEKIIKPELLEYPGKHFFETLTTSIDQRFVLSDRLNKALNSALDARIQRLEDSKRFILLVVLSLFALFLTLSWIIVRGVLRPVSAMIEAVSKLGRGEMPPRDENDYGIEFNQLKQDLNSTVLAVHALITDTILLSQAAVEGRLANRADPSQHQGDFRRIIEGVNHTLDAVIGPLNVAARYVDNLSKGEIPAKIADSYNGDFNILKNNLNNCIDAIAGMVAEAAQLEKAAIEGRLDTRADLSQHRGDYRKIVQGFNNTLDAVIGPLNVAARYVDEISKGEIPAKITDHYNGDFNRLKNNLNTCIDAINALVADADMLSAAAVAGNLATRADATQHQGDFKKIVEGVNHTLDAVISPLNVAARYVDEISKGEIPAKITDSYHGDFNTIKNNLNNCIDAISNMVAEAVNLEKAATEGRLATRADASPYQGDYKKIVQGFNHTLDAVIGPLNVAAGYVDEISKGHIPAKITDSYQGDFNVIKNNLNTCIDAINALVADADMLSNAAIEGRLATRADASKHQGDFKKIVEGVNATLDGVIHPVNEAVAVLRQVELGDLTRTIQGEYQGQLKEFKDTVNNTVAKLSQTIAEVVSAANQLGSASEQIGSTSQSLAEASSEQAASVEETSTSIEQMTASINQNTENAKVTDNMAAKAAKEAVEGGAAVKLTVEAMKQIAAKVGIIDDIAYQTNMLALNAAIEAARAGDHGKGFAVVAAEVRKLAERSQVAAQEIGHLAESSVQTAESAGKLLDQIVPSIAKTSDLVQEIAAASEEQSSGVSQINTAMHQMNQITLQNASTSEELAVTAEEINSQTEQLQNLMNFFKIPQDANA